MKIDINALGVILVALAIGYFAGSEASPPSTAVKQSDAFKSLDHCRAYYAEAARTNDALSAAWASCRKLAAE